MGWLGERRIDLDHCASTNDEAARLARAGAEHGTVVTARTQSGGRGRQGRSWHSPDDGNVYLSCILRPGLTPDRVPPITLAAGLAVSDTVNSAGASSSLKWPNDVLVSDKKIAGILTEMSTRGAALDSVVVGIGVNVGARAFPPELEPIATSLHLELGEAAPRADAVIHALLASLEEWLDRFFAGGVPAVAAAWQLRATPRPISATVDGHTIVGHARGLDHDGALLLETADGEHPRIVRIVRIVAGDVTLSTEVSS
jgi:BirA family biotin operon repressor/biotin-[acetyl-CoA-carboxylase] ligase